MHNKVEQHSCSVAEALVPGQVFHAGTALGESGDIVAAGGRVLGITALGCSVKQAQQQAYQVLDLLSRSAA